MSLVAAPPPAPADPNYAAFPVWLEFSGLPDALHAVRKNAWVVFRKLVELDCERHPAQPGVVQVAASEVGDRTGFDGAAVMKMCDGFRRKKLLRVFLPDHPDDDMLYDFRAPLAVPATQEAISDALERRFGPAVAHAPRRYWNTAPDAPDASQEDLLRRVVELYMAHMSLALNPFVLDDLAVLARRYPLAMIEAAMRSAAQGDERHLSDVYRRLKAHKRDEDAP